MRRFLFNQRREHVERRFAAVFMPGARGFVQIASADGAESAAVFLADRRHRKRELDLLVDKVREVDLFVSIAGGIHLLAREEALLVEGRVGRRIGRDVIEPDHGGDGDGKLRQASAALALHAGRNAAPHPDRRPDPVQLQLVPGRRGEPAGLAPVREPGSIICSPEIDRPSSGMSTILIRIRSSRAGLDQGTVARKAWFSGSAVWDSRPPRSPNIQIMRAKVAKL